MDSREYRPGSADVPASLGIYLHIPFCTGKCPYCDFNSRPARGDEFPRYADALEREIALRLPSGVAADTVFCGGGTPTVLKPPLLVRLLDVLRGQVALAEDAEITVEANPESVTGDCLSLLPAAGFNRLSIGVQSLDDAVLTALGRRHDAARALAAIGDARAAGWDNLSLDLIFGVPGQTAASWAATLEQAISLRPQHISAYCLTIEPGTEFHRRYEAGELTGVGEDAELEMYLTTRSMLQAAGYEHYEISNFALPGRRCRHNEKYWRVHDYIGLGAGAHSRVGDVRWANVGDPARYGELLERGRLPVSYAERLSARRRMDEELVLGLRMAEGACLKRLGARCGRDVAQEYRTRVRKLTEAGLATTAGSRLALTERGMALASEVALRIMA